MSSDLFSKGCLVQLETPVWTARRKISSKALLDNGAHEDVDPRFVNATKRLVDGKTLSTIEAIRNEARTWLYAQSLPFPLDGAVFVPASQIEKIDAKLAEFEARFDEAVSEFVKDYPALREASRVQLGSLYNVADYPQNVESSFAFSWRFLSLAPASDAQLVNPSLVAKEREKFQLLMAEAAESAVTELRIRFAACVDHLVDRLSGEDDGKPKIFRDSLVGNLRDFLDGFKALNICDDRDLADLVTRARDTLDGVEVNDLRKNESLRSTIASKMSDVQGKLDGMIVDRPSRKIRLAPAEKPV